MTLAVLSRVAATVERVGAFNRIGQAVRVDAVGAELVEELLQPVGQEVAPGAPGADGVVLLLGLAGVDEPRRVDNLALRQVLRVLRRDVGKLP